MEKIIITVSCRVDSSRLPKKALEKIEGKATIVHLLERLKRSGLLVVLCTSTQKEDSPLKEIARQCGVSCYCGSKNNVILRLFRAALHHNADHLIRVTSDDLLVDIPLMREIIKQHLENDDDYTYMTNLPAGMDCEVIKRDALERVLELNPKLENTEYISYYLKKPELFKLSAYMPPDHYNRKYRLTLDYPEDLKLLKAIFSNMPHNFTNWELIDYLDRHPYLLDINKLPKVSCYITNHNYAKYLESAVESVLYQTFEDLELIIIDDCSDDESSNVMLKYSTDQRVRLIRNEKNEGLPVTSNKALGMSKGEYIIRLDADDIFMPKAFESMVHHLDSNQALGIIYPDYYEWGETMVQRKGRETNHPAGAMIRKSCWNDIKYNENYRCQDGFDFYHKFKNRFGIGYLNQPCFVYRKHKGSLSTDKQFLKETRKQMEREHEKRY